MRSGQASAPLLFGTHDSGHPVRTLRPLDVVNGAFLVSTNARLQAACDHPCGGALQVSRIDAA